MVRSRGIIPIRKCSRALVAAAVLGWVATAASARGRHGTTSAAIGQATVTIEYERPIRKLKDPSRTLYPGQLWAIGDGSATIDSDTALDIGGSRVPLGKHILLVRLLAPGRWSLVVSSARLDQFSERDKLAEAPMQYEQGQPDAAELAIDLSDHGGNDGVVEISWGTQRLIAHFKPAP